MGQIDSNNAKPEAAAEGNFPAVQTVCSYWLKGLCMKGEDCGFLHVFDPARLPVCRNLIKFGECKEPDCPFKHTLEDVKV